MGTRIYLVSSNSSTPLEYEDKADLALCSNGLIPPLWAVMFLDEKLTRHANEDGEICYLVTKTKLAIERINDWKNLISKLCSRDLVKDINDFIEYCNKINDEYIHMDLTEISLESGVEDAEEYLKSFYDAFNQPLPKEINTGIKKIIKGDGIPKGWKIVAREIFQPYSDNHIIHMVGLNDDGNLGELPWQI